MRHAYVTEKGSEKGVKCREIVELIRAGKLVVSETAVSPADVARPIKDDLVKYRVILKAIARGEYDGYKVRFVCDRNRDGGLRGCAFCPDWFAPTAMRFHHGLEPENCGICLARRRSETLSGGQKKLDIGE